MNSVVCTKLILTSENGDNVSFYLTLVCTNFKDEAPLQVKTSRATEFVFLTDVVPDVFLFGQFDEGRTKGLVLG